MLFFLKKGRKCRYPLTIEVEEGEYDCLRYEYDYGCLPLKSNTQKKPRQPDGARAVKRHFLSNK